MTIGAGIFLIAVGAILKFATNFHVSGLSVDTIGVILMIAGAVGLVLGIFQELIWSRRARVAPGAPPPAVEERREVVEPPAEREIRRY
jgi:cytochrome c oxidase subunit IV